MDKQEYYRLIDLHVDHPSSDYKYEHIAIGGRLVDRKIYSLKQYEKECGELGIIAFTKQAKKVFGHHQK